MRRVLCEFAIPDGAEEWLIWAEAVEARIKAQEIVFEEYQVRRLDPARHPYDKPVVVSLPVDFRPLGSAVVRNLGTTWEPGSGGPLDIAAFEWSYSDPMGYDVIAKAEGPEGQALHTLQEMAKRLGRVF